MPAIEPVFHSDHGRFIPTAHARGPWDAAALHGGAPAALLADAVERFDPGSELFVARLSFEFLRPVPLAPLELRIEVLRPGRRVQLLAASLYGSGVEVCTLLALRVARVPRDVTRSPGAGSEDTPALLPAPTDLTSTPFALGPSDGESFAASTMEMRFASGGLELGPAEVWMRLRRPILDDRVPTPLVRVCAAADFGNGVSAVTAFDRTLFINPDLTIHLERLPVGDWISLAARTQMAPGEGALAWSMLGDQEGGIGLAAQALLVENR
ncbi:MAG: thioesterase family protein [Solirubrobacteraceae bacterium]